MTATLDNSGSDSEMGTGSTAVESTSSGVNETSDTGETTEGTPTACGNGIVDPGEVCLAPFVQFDGGDMSGFQVANIDSDGRSDLANYERILLQHEEGMFKSVPVLGLSGPQTRIGDFDGDSQIDLLGYSFVSGEVEVVLGDGLGNFAGPVATSIGKAVDLHVVDFDNDGKDDLLGLLVQFEGPVRIWASDGDGGFTVFADYPMQGFNVAGGDMDGDGQVDLALADLGSVHLWWGTGDGNFEEGPIVKQIGVSGVRLLDVEQDGRSEILVPFYHQQNPIVVSGVGVAWPTRGDAAGWKVASYDLGEDLLTAFPVVGDMSNDGLMDLIIVRQGVRGPGLLEVLCMDSKAELLVSCANMDFLLDANSLQTIDANNDGAFDLVSAMEGKGLWRMFAEP